MNSLRPELLELTPQALTALSNAGLLSAVLRNWKMATSRKSAMRTAL